MDPGDERKRTSDDASKGFQMTPKPGTAPGSAWKTPADWPCGVRCRGGVIRAFARNLRSAMGREKAQVATPRGRKYQGAGQGPIVVMKPGNAGGAKGAGHSRWDRKVNGQPEEPSTEGGSLQGVARAG